MTEVTCDTPLAADSAMLLCSVYRPLLPGGFRMLLGCWIRLCWSEEEIPEHVEMDNVCCTNGF